MDGFGAESDLYLVKYVEPMESNSAALGINVARDAVRREALNRAVSGGVPALSGRITLVQDGKQGPGLLYFVPVYRGGTAAALIGTEAHRQSLLLGLLYTPIVVSEIMSGVAQVADDALHIELFEGDTSQPKDRLYQSQADGPAPGGEDSWTGSAPEFQTRRTFVVGGRTLALRATSTPEFEASIDRSSLAFTAVGGVLASFIMALAVWLLAVGRVRAQRRAERMTGDLARLARVVQHTSNCVAITDAQMRIKWVNDGFTRITGYTLEEATGRTPGELLGSGKGDPATIKALLDAVAAGETCSVEILNRAKDGREYWIDTEVQPTRDEHGELIGFMELGSDVTAQKLTQLQLEAALRESDALLRTIHRHAIVSATDRGGRIVEVNEAFCRISGYTDQELRGQDHRIIDSKAHSAEFWADMWRTISAGSPWRGEICNRAQDGTMYWVDSMIAPFMGADGAIEKYVSICSDITASKSAQQQLSEMADRLTLAIEGGNDGLWDWMDVNADAEWWSPSFYALLGHRPDELRARRGSFASMVHPSHSTLYSRATEEALTGRKGFDMEFLLRTRGGDYRWFRSRAKVYLDSDGRATRMAGSLQDIHDRKQAESDLGRERQRLGHILEGTNVGTWEWNIDTGETRFNERWAQVLGYSLDELGATTIKVWTENTHPDERSRSAVLLEQHFNGELPYFECETRARHKEGHWVWVLDRGKLFSRSADGRPRWMAGTRMDVTERRALHEELRRGNELMTGVLQNLPCGLSVFDGNMQLVTHNNQFRELMDLPEALFSGPDLCFDRFVRFSAERGEYGPGDVEEIVKGVVAKARHPAVQFFERERPGGPPLEVRRAPVPGGGFVTTYADISTRKQAEIRLKEALTTAEQASVIKSQFLANMSHEIRTPMNAILGMLGLLQKTALTTRQRDYASKTEGAARSLLGLLNDILDFSKAEAGKMTLDPRPFRLDRLLRDLSVILSANVGTKTLDVLFDIDPAVPPCLLGDDMRLQQVLINLGGNAIKFTSEGEVVLSVDIVERTSDDVLLKFAVRDSGIGIAPENQAHIFSGFSQAEASTTRRFGGTGLGLAICQRLVGLMGGELGLNSAPGVGSTFYFQIRLALAVEESDSVACGLQPRLGAVRALIVDDNASAREILVDMARSLGWQADGAASGLEALAMASARLADGAPYETVFVDWQMPAPDGWETSQGLLRLAAAAEQPAPLLVMITGHGRETLTQRSAEEQAILGGFLVKPVTASMLFDAVSDARTALAHPELLNRPTVPSVRRLIGMRLLVVEDNLNNQQVALELLSDEGAHVELASNGQLGVDAVIAAEPPFDAVLMDLQMPVMDGYTATARIRQHPSFAALPIIAMTANAMASDREACLSAGMNDHVGKPFDLSQLVATLRRLTGGAESNVTSVKPACKVPLDLLADAKRRGIELAAALERMGGNGAVYLRALMSFDKDLATSPGQLTALLEQGRFNEAAA